MNENIGEVITKNECPICLENKETIVLKCEHCVCSNCLEKLTERKYIDGFGDDWGYEWRKFVKSTNIKCPLCRRDIASDTENIMDTGISRPTFMLREGGAPKYSNILTVSSNLPALTSASFTVRYWTNPKSIITCSLVNYSGTMVIDGIPYVTISNIADGHFDINITNVHPLNPLSGILTISIIVVM